jgi:enoyl-CoA hydratase/carnithine racemase
MAGTTTTSRRTQRKTSDMNDMLVQFNKAVDDLEALRAASVSVFNYKVENLSAGADITARAFFVAPVALTVLDSVKIIPEAASTGVDSGNSLIVTLRNITEGADVATITRTTDLAANTPVALTLAAAAADIAASDVLGLVVTQGAAADASTFVLQFSFQRQSVDAAGDMTAAKVGDLTGTAITE